MNELDEVKRRLKELEDLYHSQKENMIKNKYELKELIATAVSEGNKEIICKIELHEKRILDLENKEAKIVLERWKSIITTTIAWFILATLNNLPYLIGLFTHK